MPPRLHASVVPRPELLARLDQGLSKKLTLVSAPTGFGKTTLVSLWLAERRLPAAWVALDENDNDPVRFWTYAISALRRLDASLGKAALATLAASQPGSFHSLLPPLINDLARLSQARVLVLEDYHAITAPEIHAGLSFLLQNLPDALHLVLISRSQPDLPLAILRARDELIEIDAAALRFSQAETAAFLRGAVPGELPAAALAGVQERTQGWVAGLRLLALALQDKGALQDAARIIRTFSGSHRYVADYLTKEVFETLPEALQTFLLKTCFLSRLTGALCDAVTGSTGGEATLEQLERQNLFLVRLEHGGGRVWYRYNPLFAESIQVLARQRWGEAGVRFIFEAASQWYQAQHLYDQAIEAALSAKSFQRALALVEKFIEMHDIGEMFTLGRWLEAIPQELTLLHPEICLAYAQVILYSSDRYAAATATRIQPYLRAAEEAWKAEGNIGRVGAVSALRGMIAFWQGDFPTAFACVHRSLEELPEQEVLWRGVSLLNASFEALFGGKMLAALDRTLEAKALLGASQNIHGVLAADQVLSEVFYWQGDLEQSAQLNRQIMAEAVGGEEMLDDQGVARLGLADVAYEQNDLEAAEEFAAQALDLARQRANAALQAQAVVRLAYIQSARGDAAQAQESLKTFISGLGSPALLREVQCAQARLSLLANQADSLGWWLAVIAPESPPVLPVQAEREAFTLACLRIAEGKTDDALAALAGWPADAAENGRVRSQAEALCLRALAHYRAADLPQAVQALTPALAIGQGKGLRRLFLDEGAPLAALLKEALPALGKRSLSLYAAALLHSFSPEALSRPAGAGSAALVEPLSQQELRVLRYLVGGLSNADIARELVVSTNTVKTHVKSIYRKLDIRSREEAREVARELNLL